MRTETIEREIFTFDELSDEAKEKAREWWRYDGLNYEWWDGAYQDAENVAKILGIDFGSKGRNTPAIYFSGFCSQGDGASWEGDYSYSKGAAKHIRGYAPNDTELHAIADRLQVIQKRYFYQLSATVSKRGMYEHSGTMYVDVSHNRLDYAQNDAEEEITACLRDFADWIYSRLEGEYEYLMSDECVDECITMNEWEFDRDGDVI